MQSPALIEMYVILFILKHSKMGSKAMIVKACLVGRGSPLYCLALSSCKRVLMTSIGCRHAASATPPIEPGAQCSTVRLPL